MRFLLAILLSSFLGQVYFVSFQEGIIGSAMGFALALCLAQDIRDLFKEK